MWCKELFVPFAYPREPTHPPPFSCWHRSSSAMTFVVNPVLGILCDLRERPG
jgi:hypothetical protein